MKKIILFIFMFLMFNTCVYASSHLDLVPIDGIYSSQFNLSTGGYFSSNQKKYFMDGKIVYCIEPGTPIYTNEFYGVGDLSLSGIEQKTIDLISLIGYFGYDYPGHQTDKYFLATQELIWESVGNNEIYFTTGINGTGNIVNVDYEKNKIMSLVNSYYVKPSFDGNLVSGVYSDKIVLEDTNNVLSNYTVISSNNSAYIDGNKLIISLDSLGSDEITLVRNKYDQLSSVFYGDSESQDFMFLRANDVFSSVYIDVFSPRNKINIDKKGLMLDGIDSDNNFIYHERGLDGVIFGLYASEDIYENELIYYKDQLIEEMVTVDGVATSMLLPNGNYYIKELKANDGFKLDDSVIDIHLNNDKKEVYNYMVDLENERQEIFISLQKNGEFFEKIDSDTGSYINVPLSDIKFGLYSSNDIYDADGDLLINKDTLIRELVTDSDGYINEKLNIPFGTYYIKELETLPGYKLDSNIYEFSVKSTSDDNIKIMVTKEPMVNQLIKSRLVINKIDSDGNKLQGACFKIFDSFDNLIYEGITDSNGIISIGDLPYGKYYFYEVSAPNGYYLNDRIYEIFVNNDDDLIEVNVLNQKMPLTSDIYAVPRKFSAVGLGFGLLTLSLGYINEKRKNN